MKQSYPKNQCHYICFPFLSDAYKIISCCFKKEYISGEHTKPSRKVHHHSFFEIHFIAEGEVSYKIENETILLEKGHFLIISPKTKHLICSKSENVTRYSIAVSFEEALNKSIMHDMSKKPFLRSTFSEEVFTLLEYVANSKQKNDPKAAFLAGVRVYSILSSLPIKIYNTDDRLSKDSTPDVRLSDAKQYIQDNIGLNVTCTQVARHCYLSSKQLTRIFVKYEGITPIKYIIQVKTQVAEQMLGDLSISLKEISERLGFSNEYYFNAFFKKNAGMTPGEYKKTVT